ncbi:MAG TPA: anti-sigma factor [Thermomicrobiales bacterium]|nr:anti-sigma factor [Thermomicrobiales bacterium]
MNVMPDIRSHDHADMLLDDYVMGTLPANQLDWLEEHIPTCAICQVEIPLLMEAAFALPFAADEPPVAMSDDLWDRIEQSIRNDLREDSPAPRTLKAPNRESATFDPTSTWPERANHQPFVPLDLERSDTGGTGKQSSKVTSMSAYKWFALAAAAVLILGLGAVLAKNLWWPDDSATPPQTIAMVDADGEPIGSDVATLEYLPDEGKLVLEMDEMPVAPDGQIYQAWLIAGDVPVPIGTVDPVAGEFQHDVDVDEYDAFAITVEPGPSGSESPTSDPIVVAPLEPAT